jgi:membrane protein DedA with SNARE-associated domain
MTASRKYGMLRYMDMETIIRFGPLAVALGTFLEGETALLLAGAGLALGLFDFWTIVLAALAGSMAGDQFFFWLGRCRGGSWLREHPRFGKRVRRATDMLLRHRIVLLCTYRFIYGLRGTIPFAFGMSDMCWRFFLLANVITAAFWSLGITLLAMHAGKILADPAVIPRLPMLGAGVALAVVGIVLLRRRMNTRA